MWFVTDDVASEFIRDLNKKPESYPDRVVGIVLGTLLDERLAATLKEVVPQDDKILEGTFDHESRVFGTFGSRIELGFVLSIFSKETRRDLMLIAKIRNGFAHKLSAKSFDSDPIRNLIDELAIPDRHLSFSNGAMVWDFNPKLLPPISTRRDRFIRAVQALNLSLFLEPERPERATKLVPRF